MKLFKICSLLVILPLLTACSLGSNRIPTDPPPTINIDNEATEEIEENEIEENEMEDEQEALDLEVMPVDPNMEMEVQEFDNTVDEESEVEMLEGEVDVLLDEYEQFID